MNQDISTVGIDIAKRAFHVVGMDKRGTSILRKRLYRGEVVSFMAQLPRATVGMVRWADDFIITGSSKELLEHEVKPLVDAFLEERGLTLSPEKTHITPIDEGFDFL